MPNRLKRTAGIDPACVAATWVGWFAVAGLLQLEHQSRDLSPNGMLLIWLLALTFLSSTVGTVRGIRQALRGPARGQALGRAGLCLLPIVLWVGFAGYFLALKRQFLMPRNSITIGLHTLAASIMSVEVKRAYPSRMRSPRLVMHYGESVKRPEADLKAMDQHVAALEAAAGAPLRTRIDWVRGDLLGQSHMSVGTFALGTAESPREWKPAGQAGELSVDRHELAHAVMHQIQHRDADPPLLLLEGWGEAQNGSTSERRARLAWESRERRLKEQEHNSDWSYLRDLTGPERYHRFDARTYDVGGAFVEYLIGEFGMARLLRLYNEARPGRFEAASEEVLGRDFDAMETDFWEQVRRLTER